MTKWRNQSPRLGAPNSALQMRRAGLTRSTPVRTVRRIRTNPHVGIDPLMNDPTNFVAPNPPSAQMVLTQALDWWAGGEGAALVTVVHTWSSALNRPGSMMVVNRAGTSFGSASSGTVDMAIVSAALEALSDGRPRQFITAVTDEAAQATGLPCGGNIELRIEPLEDGPKGNVALLREAVHALITRRGVVLCTRLSDASRMLISVDEPADTELSVEAVRAASADTTWVSDIEREPVLFQVFNPPLRLFLVGAVHIAQALVPAARLVGFDITVIDPRPGFTSAQRFPDVTRVTDEPGLALRMASLDRRCAVVTLSHDPLIDDPALIKALHSKAFYVGALGSRKTHKARLKRLHDAKLSTQLTSRLHGPAGLSIGASGSAEIAASIVAELIAELRGQAARATAQLALAAASPEAEAT